jgi:hypothetical protein
LARRDFTYNKPFCTISKASASVISSIGDRVAAVVLILTLVGAGIRVGGGGPEGANESDIENPHGLKAGIGVMIGRLFNRWDDEGRELPDTIGSEVELSLLSASFVGDVNGILKEDKSGSEVSRERVGRKSVEDGLLDKLDEDVVVVVVAVVVSDAPNSVRLFPPPPRSTEDDIVVNEDSESVDEMESEANLPP